MRMNKKSNKSLHIMIMAVSVIALSGIGVFLFSNTTDAAPGSGAIWTTSGSCGDPQNVNEYNVGEVIYINGAGFDAGNYSWSITGQPGNSSGDPGSEVASDDYTVGSSGEFCFEAYTVADGDWGVYKVAFGNAKNDNYHVDNHGGLDFAIISGYKFNDLNMNGVWDGNEPPLNNWEICLEYVSSSNTNSTNPPTVCVETGAGTWPEGYYEFEIHSNYSYYAITLAETMKQGWSQSTPSSGNIELTLAGNDIYANNDFGNYVTPFCGDEMKNQESEQCDGADGITGKQTCSAECKIIEPEPELFPILSIIKTVDKALVSPSDTVTYTVTVSNSGDGDAVDVELLDVLPSGMTFTNADGSNSGDTEKTWTWDLLEAGADVTVKYDVLIDSNAGVGKYDNVAVAQASNFGQVEANASAKVHIPVVLGETAPSLTIEKSVAESFVNPGGMATYTVIVTNDGDAPAFNATLVDVLPTGFVFADTGKTTMTWELGDIAPTESVTITYDAKADVSTLAGKYINTATAAADDVDDIDATASLEIREVQVLGAEDEPVILPATGAGILAVLTLGTLVIGTGIISRKRTK